MPSSCCVRECKSNSANSIQKHSVFSFPSDEESKRKWITSIGRQNYYPCKFPKICELHFKKTDIERSTLFHTVEGEVLDVPLKKPRLKPNAIPTKCLGCPTTNLTTKKRKCLKQSPKSERPENNAVGKRSHVTDEYVDEEPFHTLDDIVDHFESKSLPLWTLIRTENYVCFTRIVENPLPVADFLAYVGEDMKVALFFKEIQVKSLITETSTIRFPASVESGDFLENIFMDLNKKLEKVEKTVIEKIHMAVDILDSMIDQIPEKKSTVISIKDQIDQLS